MGPILRSAASPSHLNSHHRAKLSSANSLSTLVLGASPPLRPSNMRTSRVPSPPPPLEAALAGAFHWRRSLISPTVLVSSTFPAYDSTGIPVSLHKFLLPITIHTIITGPTDPPATATQCPLSTMSLMCAPYSTTCLPAIYRMLFWCLQFKY